MMFRFFDIFFSILGLFLTLPLMILLLFIGWFDTKSPLFIQKRMSRSKKPFYLLKFRTMYVGTIQVGTHEIQKSSVTRWGSFLRRNKLDELPQLFNVLLGDMSLVGPRPNLFNQNELIGFREKLNVYSVRPGITGLAQVKEIDMSTPELLARIDAEMIQQLNMKLYFSLIIQTVLGKGTGDRIKNK